MKAPIDRNSNNISLFEVLEQMTLGAVGPQVGDLPKDQPIVVPMQADFVVLSTRSDPNVSETGRGRFQFTSPGNKSLAGGDFELDLKDNRRCRSIAHIDALPIVGPGVYEFVVEFQNGQEAWDRVASIPLEVLFQDAPAPQVTAKD